MAIRKMESFGWAANGGDVQHNRWNLTAGNSWIISTPGRRAGSKYAWNATYAQGFDNQQVWIIHCAIRFDYGNQFLFLRDAGSDQLFLQYDTTNLILQCRRGDNTVLGSASAVAKNVWHHLIWRSVIDNTAGQTEVRLNGQTLFNLSGIDTQQTANAYANQVRIVDQPMHDIVISDGAGAAPYNGILGDMAVYCVLPNAAGAVSDWTRSGGAANFEMVDDSSGPDGDSTYNSTSTAGATDRYALPDSVLAGACRGVMISAYVRKDDAGVRTARVKLYDGTALQSGPTRNLADSYAWLENVWQVNPTSGTHWTPAELGAAEPGIELVS